MDVVHRRTLGRALIAPLLVVALIVGYALYTGAGGSPAVRRGAPAAAPTKLTASDLVLAATNAKTGMFLQYDGVTGPPATPDHSLHAPVTSLSWGTSRTSNIGAAGGGRFGTPNIQDLHITRPTDKYSVPLMKESLASLGTGNAIIYFTHASVKGQAVDYLEFDLTNVAISSWQIGNGGGELPTESISLNFTKIEMKAHFAGAPAQSVAYDLVTHEVTGPPGP